MDKLVGKLVQELERLKLREDTLILFSGDNGTASFGADAATVNGKSISGRKATMLEGGSRVPLIANWPGTTPPGTVSKNLVDFSDFFATCAELGAAPLPQKVTLDSRSFAAQVKGSKDPARDWVYVELKGKSYVRDSRFKLTNDGELFDLVNAPFSEIAVPKDTADTAAISARGRLQAVLDTHPAKAPDGLKSATKENRKAKRKAKRKLRNES
jgi:arylsulfatase A